MTKLRKCGICGELIAETEEEIKYKNRYVHQRCFNVQMKALTKNKTEQIKEEANKKKTKKSTTKPKAELKDAVSEEDYQEKKKFYEKLRSMTGEDKLSAKVYVLVDKYISRYAYTFKGMYDTLLYLEMQEKELTGDIVGLIPYSYSDAEKYFSDMEMIEKRIKDAKIEEMYQQKVVMIKPKQRIPKQLSFDDE